MINSKKKPCIPDILPIDLDWKRFVSLVSQASMAIARYDGTLNGILNSAVLLSPITAQEAILSSQMEGTQATLVEVLEHEAGQTFEEEKTKDIQEVLNYRKALLIGEGYLNDRFLSMSLIRELHMVLMGGVRGKNKNPGKFRENQNWIGKPGRPIEEARFIPPDPLVMKTSLDNLEKFMADNFENPLVQMAIIHAQFEIIHPFDDGNGRLGRMLIPLSVSEKSFAKASVYLSEYLEKHDAEYRDRLLAITESGDWQGWVEFFLKATIIQAEKNSEKAKKIHELYERMKGDFSSATNSKYALAALDTFFAFPIINASAFYKKARISTKTTAHSILKALKEAGLIATLQEGRGQLPALYALPELINISEGKKVFRREKTTI